jgi:hypothetical protein
MLLSRRRQGYEHRRVRYLSVRFRRGKPGERLGSGTVVPVTTGLTTVTGVAFDNRGRMYVLENSVNSGFPTPGNGTIVRITGSRRDVIASGLALPTAMTFGPDGALYVSNWGFGPPPSLLNGPGQVLRIAVPN